VPESSLNEKLIIDYLLGVLPESEIERLDELSVTDDEVAEYVEAVENELVDDYIRNELPEKTRTRFESYYLTSATRREKVAIARTLTKRADKGTVSDHVIRPSSFANSRAFQWTTIAAAVVMLVLGGYLLLTNIQMQNQIAQMKEEHTALKKREDQLQREIAQQRSMDQQKEAELALTKQKLETLEKQLGEQGSLPEKLFAFSLSPQQREISTVTEIKIPAATESVVVTLKLESDDFDTYETVLKNSATDEILWRSDAQKSSNQTVVVKLPAKILKPQDYILDVFGINKSGDKEIISGYPFHVLIE
jgi:hypothetical protein